MRTRNGIAASTGKSSFRPKIPQSHPEREIQKNIVSIFAALVKPGDAILFAVPNGEKRDIATATMLSGPKISDTAPDELFLIPAGQGVLSGVTDLVLISAGGVVDFIEVKAPERPQTAYSKRVAAGKLSRPQIIFRDAVVKLAHNHHVIYSIDDFTKILKLRGVPTRKFQMP